jgi:hypothetical protein
MIKALSALTIAAFVATAMTILPSFAPRVEASVPQALAKGDRLPVHTASASCATQHWPTMDASCLRRSNWKTGVQSVRVVTTDRN